MNIFKDKIIKSHEIQIIRIHEGIILKKGCLTTLIKGKNEAEITELILKISKEGSNKLKDILIHFPIDYHDKIEKFIINLVEKNILYSTDEDEKCVSSKNSNLENFFWNFKKSVDEVVDAFTKTQFTIIGINHISKQLINDLIEMNLNNFRVVDYPSLRNQSFFKTNHEIDFSKWSKENYYTLLKYEQDQVKFINELKKNHCVIATSDIGAITSIRKLHFLCYNKGLHFLPITLQDNIGQIGPLTIPKQTICYECLLSRLNSNFENYKLMQKVEEVANESQHVVGFLPSMANILANFASIELSKFYGGWFSSSLLNCYFEINLVDARFICHPILKLPRCSVCSPSNIISSITAEKKASIPVISLDSANG